MSWTSPTVTGTFPDPAPSGVGGSVSLPVATVPDADKYFATTPRNAEWAALAPNQQVWLNESQRYLEQLCFDQGADCCGKSFEDAWEAVVSEVALALSKNPTAVIGSGAASTGTTGAIKSQKLGDLQQDFYDVKLGGSTTSKYGPNAPAILQRFPWISDFVGCWMAHGYGSSRILSRCC
jgi:hypothetical protein